jgi:ABC-2 type transport system permease protein
MSSRTAVARAVAWRTIHNTFSTPAGIIPSLIPPLFFLAAFAGGLSTVARLPHFNYTAGYTSFVYGFAFLQSATLAGVFTGLGVARDFDSGFAKRLLVSAPARGGIILGYVVAAVARWIAAGAVVTIAALIAGAHITARPGDLVALIAVGVLANILSALWACGTAMFLRTEQAGALIQLPVFVLLFLAPVYVPITLISGWVHTVATINPATAPLEAIRGSIAGSPTKIALTFAILAAGILITGIWARRGLGAAESAATT